ncbi:MAG: SDR family oxidoreductase [Halobacteriales archaeon]
MDRTVVVTGGTRGIGRAAAERFDEAGDRVVVCSRDGEDVEETVEQLDDAVGVRADVRDEYDVERLVETATRHGPGGIDVVVAGAGVFHGDPGESPLPETSYSEYDDTLRTNARGVFATLKQALAYMPDDGRAIVPTGRIAREEKAGYGAYAVSKAAAEAVVRGFAADAEPAFGCVEPGAVATDLTGGQGRDPADAAEMIYWAATDLDAADLDGSVVDLKEYKRATA